jgi:hypothetical protein
MLLSHQALFIWGAKKNSLGFSKWVSAKRTRSYPFDRIYNTYHLPKKVTIIPVIKDEGIGGACDRINFITLSWMNLLNVYIILAWYDQAQVHRTNAAKITTQRFDTDYVRGKLDEIGHYHQTALHWNIQHFEQDFEIIYQQAASRYQQLSKSLGVEMHPYESHLRQFERYQVNGRFDSRIFRDMSLAASYEAVQREIVTQHALESLSDGTKAYFSITNWLGGEYHLTTDEVYFDGDTLVIQESKNASRTKFPGASDIKDGLFKLILFANMDELYHDDRQVPFRIRLKITGQFSGTLTLPTTQTDLDSFVRQVGFRDRQTNLLKGLNEEAIHNPRLEITIRGNL